MTEPAAPNRYVGGVELKVSLGGSPYRAMVHLGLVDGVLGCVGLDLRAFEEFEDSPGIYSIVPGEEWGALTARRVRELRLENLVQEAIREHRAMYEFMLEDVFTTPHMKRDSRVARALRDFERLEGSKRPRPGRPAALSEVDLVRVVAATYSEHVKNGGRSPVVAVQRALEDAQRLLGAGPKGEVTIGQARAAVRRARQLGFLPGNNRGDG